MLVVEGAEPGLFFLTDAARDRAVCGAIGLRHVDGGVTHTMTMPMQLVPIGTCI